MLKTYAHKGPLKASVPLAKTGPPNASTVPSNRRAVARPLVGVERMVTPCDVGVANAASSTHEDGGVKRGPCTDAKTGVGVAGTVAIALAT